MTGSAVTVGVVDGKVVLQHDDLVYPMTCDEVVELVAKLMVYAGVCPEYKTNFSDLYFQVGKKVISLTESLQSLQKTYSMPAVK